MSGCSETYLFNSSHNIDLSNKVTRRLKICVSFADKYIYQDQVLGERLQNQWFSGYEHLTKRYLTIIIKCAPYHVQLLKFTCELVLMSSVHL